MSVHSTVVCPREGSFALASFGRVRKVQETAFAVPAGRKSVALKRILEADRLVMCQIVQTKPPSPLTHRLATFGAEFVRPNRICPPLRAAEDVERSCDAGSAAAVGVQPCRFTISLIQIGANGEVQPFEQG